MPNISPKVKIAIVCILMMAILVACSSRATATELARNSTPTTISAPATATLEIPATATKQPTQVSTETVTVVPTKEIKDYPPTNVQGTCTATFSMENLVKTDVVLPNGVYLTRWIPCELPNGQTVAMAYTVQELKTGYIFIAIGWEASAARAGRLFPDGEYEGDNPWGLDDLNYKLLNAAKINGKKVRFTFTTGSNSNAILEHDNPYANVLVGDLGNRMVAFAEPADDAQDDPTYLPTYPGIPYPVFFPFRIENMVVLDK